ncbi:hypothetical protein BCh11DRAFT_06281 [Burkholderia sp. Ch1-1]|uniref:Uncharacterized protein n=1 Tax=Paraburkholderia dioscoreae TaxID=2604047 RepID=A0A5Q4ZM71_9BURK|nr:MULTISPECIES: hypothetical protein [Paraburkholderia]EIF30775.1 hypothetical protein BCh11DRAFT_06281 [Burkholderia sp. Ch1-1]MDR8398564.1 hypothetical protein [Paraburkholderia sp. USG1]VVD28986.1 conserved membrane protein of unknown function [Paraburkholderia dioscoreae]
MNIWLGLLAAPTVVLATQSINYALIRLVCGTGAVWPLHLVSALAFGFCVLSSWLGWASWRAQGHADAPAYASRASRGAFFALMAMVVGALSAVVQLAMWFPQWVLPPCR